MHNATHQQTRTHNVQLVLKTIFDAGKISRAAVARETGLTAVTVSQIVTELMTSGLVVEGERGESVRGRAPILISVDKDAQHILSVHIKNDAIDSAIVNLQGDIIFTDQVAIGAERGEQVVELILQALDTLQTKADRPLLGIGIAAPGIIDTDRGVVEQAVYFGWRDLPLGQQIADRYGIPVHIANASQVTALAAFIFDNMPRASNVAVVHVGQDVGAGFIVNGQFFVGDGYGAGEIGHIVLDTEGEPCRCGNRGCLETLVNTAAIVREARRLAAQVPAGPLAHLVEKQQEQLTFDDLLPLYHQGDPQLSALATRTAQALGHVIAGIAVILNIEKILLVGSVTRFGEAWLARIQEQVTQRGLPRLTTRTTLAISKHGSDMVTLGATALVLARELGITLGRR
ncbi:MAG: ROK family transcriptional regulator [Caldilineaceae bacterium]|nr:ROK family transcriptional regulator [Caldilineaceae bacterium]